MTETLIAHAVTWREAQLGLWVATAPDARPLGIVAEKWVHGFVVTGRTGKHLGSYPSLAEAKAALEATLS
jgi:hypothetical protein